MGLAKWENAPLWAEWFAVDYSGAGWWYKIKPTLERIQWYAYPNMEATQWSGGVDMTGINWRETLERRPQPTETPATFSADSKLMKNSRLTCGASITRYLHTTSACVSIVKHAHNSEPPTKPRDFTKTL